MKKILITILFFYAQVAIAGGDKLKNEISSSYIECNLKGIQKSRNPISDRNFVSQSSLESVVHDLLVARNKELSIFLANKGKMNEPDYIDQAMEFFRGNLGSGFDCFRNAYEDGDVVYKFQQVEAGSRVEGFAVANRIIKAVIYTVVVTD